MEGVDAVGIVCVFALRGGVLCPPIGVIWGVFVCLSVRLLKMEFVRARCSQQKANREVVYSQGYVYRVFVCVCGIAYLATSCPYYRLGATLLCAICSNLHEP